MEGKQLEKEIKTIQNMQVEILRLVGVSFNHLYHKEHYPTNKDIISLFHPPKPEKANPQWGDSKKGDEILDKIISEVEST